MTLEDTVIFQVYGIDGYATGTDTPFKQHMSKIEEEKKESESENQNPVGT